MIRLFRGLKIRAEDASSLDVVFLLTLSVMAFCCHSNYLKGDSVLNNKEFMRHKEIWGSFRLSVVGGLLASPPPHGMLKSSLEALSKKSWKHPITGDNEKFSFSTIEEWYYKAKGARHSPVKALERKLRTDGGIFRSISESVRQAIIAQHKDHPGWSHQLHYDNLKVVARKSDWNEFPSYASVRRYRTAKGLLRVRTPRYKIGAPTKAENDTHLEPRETRGFESSHVLGLIHSDFHHCSRKLLNENGEWVKPVLVSFIDDRSRLICHAQWYWRETAQNFIHGLCQAILKRGVPRALMTDNGSPMVAAETRQGLERLSILHKTTLPYSPQQNGKQESFWGQVEGRLMAMLEGENELTLKLLNEATIAWVEVDYHRRVHSEIGQTPLDRFLAGPDVARPSPSPEELQMAFTVETTRSLRRSDCTISLEGRRYEIPSSFRHLRRISVRYAHWNLSSVLHVNRECGDIIGRLYPQDLEKNSSGARRRLDPPEQPTAKPDQSAGIAPLLDDCMKQYSITGLPMAYIPKGEEQ